MGKGKRLKKGDMVGFPVNTKSEIPQWGGVDYKRGKNTHTLNSLDFGSKDFWWIVGYYIADGWYRITKRKGATDNYRIVISGDDNKIERFKEKNNMFHATISKEGTANKIHIVNKELTCYLMQFGKGAKNKHLTSDILNLPNDLLSAFLDGYFENDGCIIGNLRKASTVSKELALGIQACVHKVERKLCPIYHSVPPEFCTIESRVVHQSEVYDIRYPVINKKETKWFYKDNYIWTPVKSKIIINTDVEVYNFEVEGDNSYVANNIAVHNCQDISIAGKQKGIKDGKRSGIFYNIIDLIKGKEQKDRPEWLVIENVKNLLSIHGGCNMIGLIDIDGKLPNLALMKISSYYKAAGERVEFVRDEHTYDRIYGSAIFTKSADKCQKLIDKYGDTIQIGGTGFDITGTLPREIDACRADYDLYTVEDIFPGIRGAMTRSARIKKAQQIVDAGIGFTSRGCVRKCPFCFVSKKEPEFKQDMEIADIVNPRSNVIILHDNNMTADPLCIDKLHEIRDRGLKVDIDQGHDVRLMTEDIASALSEVRHLRSVHYAWDLMGYERQVLDGIDILSRHIKPYKQMCFVLVGFNTEFEEDEYRVAKLMERGISPYIMRYNERRDDIRLNHFARWVNSRICKAVPKFEDYEPWIKAQASGM